MDAQAEWRKKFAPSFHCVILAKDGLPSRLIATCAARMEVTACGALCLIDTEGRLLRAFAPGQWLDAYQASAWDGDPMGFDQELDLEAPRKR